MAAPPPEPMPLILTDASLKLNDIEMACVASHVELSPDTSITTVETMCGTKDYPGTVKWSLIATLAQSFTAGSTEDTLSQIMDDYRASGALPTFAVSGYKSRAIGADNPEWTGELIPQDYSPLNGDAGDVSNVEIEWSLTGPPVKNVTVGP